MVENESEIIIVLVDGVCWSWSYWWILYRVGSWLWIVVVYHDRGGSWWLITMVDPDSVSGSWSWCQLIVDYYFKQDFLIYNMHKSRTLLTITPQFIYFSLCYKLFFQNNIVNSYFADILHNTWHLLHFCHGRVPSHMVSSEVYIFVPPINRVFW